MFVKVYKVIVASSLQSIFEVNATFLKVYSGEELAASFELRGARELLSIPKKG